MAGAMAAGAMMGAGGTMGAAGGTMGATMGGGIAAAAVGGGKQIHDRRKDLAKTIEQKKETKAK